MCFYLGMGLIGRFACGFVMITESVPKKYQASFGTASMIGDVVATLYICFFLRYISSDAFKIIWIGFALNILGVILAYWLVESPAWLLSVQREKDAIVALQYMAKINGVTDFHIETLIESKFETEDPV